MALKRSEVEHVARLARLALSDEEKDRLARELGAILDWVRQLEALDVSDVPATAHVVPMTAPLRDDTVLPGLDSDDIVGNAPERLGGQVVVPRVL